MLRRYVAKYVRQPDVVDALINGRRGPHGRETVLGATPPVYVQGEQMVVCLIDISGYSKLSGLLAQRCGRFGSEIISDTVGKYLSQIIDVIDGAKGDVVKFLGDAMLVRFPVKEISKFPIEDATKPDSISPSAIKHVIDCCLDILAIYHDYSVNFQTQNQQFGSQRHNSAGRKSFVGGDLSDLEGYKLSLHIGMTAGMMDNVIVGLPGERLDYAVNGPALHSLGDILKAAGPGELALPYSLWQAMIDEFPIFIRGKVNCQRDVAVISKGDSSFTPGFTLPTTKLGRRASLAPLPTSVVRRLSRVDNHRSVTNYIEDSKTVFTWFLNASLVYKLNNGAQNKDDTNQELEEYRSMTILFLKLRFPFDACKIQRSVEIILECLKKYDGVMQQFSIDDKGTTILSVFGLPPFTHENELEFSIKCALEIGSMLKNEGLLPFSMGMGTGDTLFSVLGNSLRSDAGLLSDVVVIAARLMDLDAAENCVICDDATRQATIMNGSEGDCFQSLGAFQLKGRSEPMTLWKVCKPAIRARSAKATDSSKSMIGYAEERDRLLSALREWKSRSELEPLQIIIEGNSGMGKSFLVGNIMQELPSMGLPVCSSAGMEIEKATPHFVLQGIVAQLFSIITRNAAKFGLETELTRVKSRRESGKAPHRPRMTSLPHNMRSNDKSAQILQAVRDRRTSGPAGPRRASGTSGAPSPSLDRRLSAVSTISSASRRIPLPGHLAGFTPIIHVRDDEGTASDAKNDQTKSGMSMPDSTYSAGNESTNSDSGSGYVSPHAAYLSNGSEANAAAGRQSIPFSFTTQSTTLSQQQQSQHQSPLSTPSMLHQSNNTISTIQNRGINSRRQSAGQSSSVVNIMSQQSLSQPQSFQDQISRRQSYGITSTLGSTVSGSPRRRESAGSGPIPSSIELGSLPFRKDSHDRPHDSGHHITRLSGAAHLLPLVPEGRGSTVLDKCSNSMLSVNAVTLSSSMMSINSVAEPRSDAVHEIMKKFGELESLPLLNFLPWACFEETESVKALSAAVRNSLLKTLLLRLFDHVTAVLKIVLVFDNGHWIDHMSLDIISSLSKRKLCLLILTRPLSGNNTQYELQRLAEDPNAIKLQLNGLSELDVEQLIKTHYGRPLQGVDPRITQALYKKCGGHPFYTTQLISAMKETGRDHLTVDNSQTLVIRTRNFDLNLLLAEDVQTAVMTRFDKLNPEFQRLLKTAAIIGQYFDLDELLGVLNEENLTLEILDSKIRHFDTQGFLVPTSASDSSSLGGSERSQYAFQNILVVNTIVQSMSVQQRNNIHERIAEYFESCINEENMNILLPTIAYHYSNSANLPKTVDFMEALAILQMDQGAFGEVVYTTSRLIGFFSNKTETQLRQVFLEGPPSLLRRGSWSCMLGEAQRQLHQNEQAVANLQAGLKGIGLPWPKTRRKVMARLVGQLALHQVDFLKSIVKPSSAYNLNRADFRNDYYKEQVTLEYRILNSMCDVLLWIGRPLDAALALIRLLNITKLVGTKADVVGITLKASLWARLNHRPMISNMYYRSAMKLYNSSEILYETEEELDVSDIAIVKVASVLLYHSGQLTEAIDLCNRGMMISSKLFRTPPMSLYSVLGSLMIQVGKFHESRALFQSEWSEILATEDPIHKSLMLTNILLNTVLLDDGPGGRRHVNLAGATTSVADKDEHANASESFVKVYGESKSFVLFVALVVHYVHHENYTKALEFLFKTIGGLVVPATSHMLEIIIVGCVYVSKLIVALQGEKNQTVALDNMKKIATLLESWKVQFMASLKSPVNVLEPIARTMVSAMLLCLMDVQLRMSNDTTRSTRPNGAMYLMEKESKLKSLMSSRVLFRAMYYSLALILNKLYLLCEEGHIAGSVKEKKATASKKVGDAKTLRIESWERETLEMLDQLGLEKLKEGI
ncbi:hypothetical protein HDV05_007208 [Chytridiales sp. JEL 0842]|nr:hypothetical protein HDV05_007208 [Chytridiales sp. JEL 0842]